MTWIYLSPSKQSLDQRHNKIAVADIDKAYSNTQDETLAKMVITIIDLLTIFTKSPIPDTWSGPDFISGRSGKFL